MPLWLWITIIVFLSLIIGVRMGYHCGYEDAITDIANVGTGCNAKCENCENPCGLKYYVTFSQIKIEK